MPSLIGQKALQLISRKLPFCYICGNILIEGDKQNRDHIPPSSCISQKDKAHSPLILPTHVDCNESFKVDDERTGQFLAMLHGKVAKKENRRLAYKHFSRHDPSHQGERFGSYVRTYPTTSDTDFDPYKQGRVTEAITNVDMYGVVKRWIRTFHAALYMQPLPSNTKFAIELPFEVISPIEDGSHIIDNGRARQRTLCEETIASNRPTKTIDQLAAWNGNLKYECVWVLTPLHAYCVFWLDFYNWSRLARLTRKKPRDCVGFYILPLGELPAQATCESEIITMKRSYSFGL